MRNQLLILLRISYDYSLATTMILSFSSFLKFDYNTSQCGSHWVYPTRIYWALECIDSNLSSNLESFLWLFHYFFKYSFFFLLLAFPLCVCWYDLLGSYRSFRFCPLYSIFLLLILVNLNGLVFNLINSLFCLFKSAITPI